MFGRKDRIPSEAAASGRGFDSYEFKLGDEMRGERATMGKSLMDVHRELRIKASYIAAIENADLSAFDSLSFVAGYVRSYARYLDMNPDTTFARFCDEAGFGGFSALKPMESEASRRKAIFSQGPVARLTGKGAGKAPVSPLDPLLGSGNLFARTARRPAFAGFEPGALGSLAVLALLVAGLGYGGWTVVKEIQRVQIAPVEQAPDLVAELDPLEPQVPAEAAPDEAGVDAPSPDALARLYRPQALDAPILTARDAPISTIRPGTFGAFASAVSTEPAQPETILIAASVKSALDEALGEAVTDSTDPTVVAPATPRVLAQAPDAVVLVAVRPAWVRVRSASGDTLFEKILDAGETYEVPVAEAPATLRTGNSGALYFNVAGQTYGPVAPGAQVVSKIALAADTVTARYAVADLEGDADLARVVAELTAEPSLPEALTADPATDAGTNAATD